MNEFLQGKRILFISTKFYGYDADILSGLRNFGAQVDFFYDDPFDYIKFLNPQFLQHKLGIKYKYPLYNRLQKRILKKTIDKKYDFVFVLKGSLITISFLKSLKDNHPESVFIQYQWDSIKNFDYTEFLPYYNLNFSFDASDAAAIVSLKHLHMFARNEFYGLKKLRQNVKQDIDILFVGSNHSNRLLKLRKLKQQLQSEHLKAVFFVYLPFFVGLKGVFISKKLKRDELMLKAITKDRLKRLLVRSKYVLDLPSPGQTGTTPRALEALAAGCKLIISNPYIKNEIFFNSTFVSVVDANDLSGVKNILLNATPGDADINVDKYSLSNWLKTIFFEAIKESEGNFNYNAIISSN